MNIVYPYTILLIHCEIKCEKKPFTLDNALLALDFWKKTIDFRLQVNRPLLQNISKTAIFIEIFVFTFALVRK